MNYYISSIKKYAVFEGRARRAEFWYFVLFNSIISMVLSILITISPKIGSLLLGLYLLFQFIPALSVTVRRLHDTDRSGWWWFILFIPFVGPIILIVFSLLDSQTGQNKYGPNLKESMVDASHTMAGQENTTNS